MTAEDVLDDRVRELANLRRQLEEVKAQEALREDIYMRLPEYADFMTAQLERVNVEARIRDAETWVRVAGLALYEATSEKKFPGVTIKMFKTIKYEPQDALEWCKEKYPEALTFQKNMFEKAAEVLKPTFVKFGEEPRVTIASDLSLFLDGD